MTDQTPTLLEIVKPLLYHCVDCMDDDPGPLQEVMRQHNAEYDDWMDRHPYVGRGPDRHQVDDGEPRPAWETIWAAVLEASLLEAGWTPPAQPKIVNVDDAKREAIGGLADFVHRALNPQSPATSPRNTATEKKVE